MAHPETERAAGFSRVALVLTTLVCLPAALLIWLDAKPTETSKEASDIYALTPSANEQAALEMLRLGADRWMMKCAYEQGRVGASQETMLESCAVDWELIPEVRIANER